MPNGIGFKGFIVGCAVTVISLFYSGASLAQQPSGTATLDGLVAYYAIVPSEILEDHPRRHPESTMHGGVPRNASSHHLVLALFDKESSDRIVDAQVLAKVSETGLAGVTKRLEPFSVNDALTYGNYFNFARHSRYRVVITIEIQGRDPGLTFGFDYQHN